MTKIDRELRGRMKSILVRLWLLAEGPASSALRGMDKLSGSGEMSRPPRRTDSLYEEWEPKLSTAAATGDADKLMKVCLAAETELMRYRGQYQAEMELPNDEKLAMQRVVEVYENKSPAEVVRRLASNVSIGWVEKARRHHRRHPDTGKPLEGWAGWTEERRAEEIRKAKARGWTQRKAADEFDAPLATLHRRWRSTLARV